MSTDLLERPATASPTTRRPGRRPVHGWLPLVLLVICALGALWLRLNRPDLLNFSRDDSWLLLYLRDWFRGGDLPLVGIGSSQGVQNGALTLYLTALPAGLGDGAAAAYGTVAVLHASAVLMTGWLTARYFGWPAALIAAAFFALHPWSIVYGRSLALAGFLPPFAVIFVGCLALFMIEGRRWALPVAGLLAGLLPQVHLGGIWLWPLLALAVVSRPAAWSARLLGLTSALLALPFTPWFIWNAQRDWIDLRHLQEYAAQSGASTGEAWRLLWEMAAPDGYGGTLGMAFERFVARGGLAPPLVTDFVHLLFVGGLAVCLAGLLWGDRLPRTGRIAPGRRGFLLILAWLLIVPAALSRPSQDAYPHYLYLAFPAPLVVVGIGLGVPAGWLARFRSPIGLGIAAGIVVLVVTSLSLAQARSYQAFLATYAEGGTEGGFGQPLGRQEKAVAEVFARAGTAPVYLVSGGDQPGLDGEATNWEYLRGDRPARLVAGSRYLVYPRVGPGYYLIAPELPADSAWPGLRPVPEGAIRGSHDLTGYRILRGPGGPELLAGTRFTAGHYEAAAGPVRVIGQTASSPWRPGLRQRISVYWQPAGPRDQAAEFQMSVQLLDPSGRLVAQHDGIGGPATQWQADELIICFFDLDLPANLEPGTYRLETVLYRHQDLSRLEWRDPRGQPAGAALRHEVVIGG